MRVAYQCKYCKHFIGEVNRPEWSSADAEKILGFGYLSSGERLESVAYNHVQEEMTVQTICEHCQHAVESNPQLLVEGKLLQ